jgi:hypothetical protein
MGDPREEKEWYALQILYEEHNKENSAGCERSRFYALCCGWIRKADRARYYRASHWSECPIGHGCHVMGRKASEPTAMMAEIATIHPKIVEELLVREPVHRSAEHN